MSKKNAILLLLVLFAVTGYGQYQSPNTQGFNPVVDSGLVGQYCQGASSTNNNRTPIWFWLDISGLAPNATYRYYASMDTLNSSPSTNGAGNCYLINKISGTIRRTSNVSMTNPLGYDSLLADSAGHYSFWFGVEPTGNGRYLPGTTIYPKIMLNNGAGGSTVMYRIDATAYPVSVINYGTTNSPLQGTALYDSLSATPKNMICLYDTVTATGRPISIAITEDDGMDLFAVSSIANFYQNMVDTLPMHWGTIIPNQLANGVRALEERSFTTGSTIDVVTDADGWWCSGVNTANMSGGSAGTYLNSTFSLSSSAVIPDTAWAGLPANFNASSNAANATYTWDFGDTSTATGAMTSHTYYNAGVVSVQVVVSTGGCSDTIWHNVIVLLGLTIPRHTQLAFDITPNPSDGNVNITSKTSTEKHVSVYNVLGDVAYTTSFSGNNTSLDLTGLEKGVYFIRVEEDIPGGKTATKRIVIQ